ncbi:hypothetical protein PS850_01070 [Pseudomonas fluorescens]|nr:hypothetical protein PS850_01070 [Pseudomonas fluorescens]
MKDVVFTFALACLPIFAYWYRHKLFSTTTLMIVLFAAVTLDQFDWL